MKEKKVKAKSKAEKRKGGKASVCVPQNSTEKAKDVNGPEDSKDQNEAEMPVNADNPGVADELKEAGEVEKAADPGVAEEVEKPEEAEPGVAEEVEESEAEPEGTEEAEEPDVAEEAEEPEEEEPEKIGMDEAIRAWRFRDPETETRSSMEYFEEVAASVSEDVAAKIADSIERINGFEAGSGVERQKIEDAVGNLMESAADLLAGIITGETLSLLIKAVNYDTDVAKSYSDGRVNGLNTMIEEKFLKAADKTSDKEEVPALGGSSAGSDRRQPTSIFDLASFAR